MTLPWDLLTASDVSLYFRVTYRTEVKSATIRQWASRGHINTHGKGRQRYSLREVVAYAQQQEIVSPPLPGGTHG
jgi:hypothetical protein